MTRVVDAGAGALFAFRHDDAKEGSAFKTNCAAAAVLAHVTRGGVVAGVGGSAAIPAPRATRFAMIMSEAAAAVEASEKEDALELELEHAMGIRRRPKPVTDEASVTGDAGDAETSGGVPATPRAAGRLGGARSGANRARRCGRRRNRR